MGGGTLIQLDGQGPLNRFLSGGPTVSLFQASFRRHTHFATEYLDLTPQGRADWGQQITFVIPRNGDLLTDAHLRLEIPSVNAYGTSLSWCHYLGFALIDRAELYIGSTKIETLFGEWLYLQSRLSCPEERRKTLDFMIGERDALVSSAETLPGAVLTIPLPFWFTRHLSHALPCVALSCEEVTIRVKLRPWEELLRIVNPAIAEAIVGPLRSVTAVIQMVYLQPEERLRFSQDHYIMLLEQIQRVEERALRPKGSIDLTSMGGCVKELVAVFQREQATSSTHKVENGFFDYNDFANYVSNANQLVGTNMVRSLSLQLNGLDYLTPRDPQFFNLYVPYKTHTSMPPTGVFVVPIALQPEELSPTGSLNLDKVDDVRLLYEGNTAFPAGKCLARVYSVRYNVLEIIPSRGQARLLFQ